MLQVNLFTRPRYCHYYFGDYYDDAYLSIGIFPQFESEQFHTWYDPIYMYDRWHNHQAEPRWEEYERHEYDLRRANKDLRPPKTYHEMETRQARMPEDQRRNIHIARPLTEAAASRATMRFEQINTKTRRKITTQATEVQKFSDKRNLWESAPTTEKTTQRAEGFKGLFAQPSEHKEPVSTPAEHKSPVMQPSEHREPVSQPVERKSSVTQPADNTPVFISPRKVRATKPETVKIPKSPIVGKSVDSDKSKADRPPNNPADERKQVDDTRNKDKGRDKNK